METIEIIELGNYTGVKIPKTEISVDEDDIDAQVRLLCLQHASYESKNGTADYGDAVLIDYAGSVDGVPFEGGTDTGYTLELGSGTFIPGFEEQLVGAQAGDQIDVTVTFPEQYHAPQMAGKDAVFACTVHDVQHRVIPEPTDDWIASVTPCNTLTELKDQVRKQVLEQKTAFVKEQSEDQILNLVVQDSQVKIPTDLISERAQILMKNMEMQLAMQGATIDLYLEQSNQTKEDLEKLISDNAILMLKRHAVMTEVARLEGFSVSEEDVSTELSSLAQQYSMDVETIKARLGEEHMETLRADLLAKKGLAHMVAQAVME